MKHVPRPCVVLSDYPIKTMAYQRFLKSLGEGGVYSFNSFSSGHFKDLRQAKLVVCDMNIMVEFEAETLSQLEKLFPHAHILFLEEDHSDMRVRFSGQRDVCRLGKLAEINVIYSTVKELLLQAGRHAERILGEKTRQAEQT